MVTPSNSPLNHTVVSQIQQDCVNGRNKGFDSIITAAVSNRIKELTQNLCQQFSFLYYNLFFPAVLQITELIYIHSAPRLILELKSKRSASVVRETLQVHKSFYVGVR